MLGVDLIEKREQVFYTHLKNLIAQRSLYLALLHKLIFFFIILYIFFINLVFTNKAWKAFKSERKLCLTDRHGECSENLSLRRLHPRPECRAAAATSRTKLQPSRRPVNTNQFDRMSRKTHGIFFYRISGIGQHIYKKHTKYKNANQSNKCAF